MDEKYKTSNIENIFIDRIGDEFVRDGIVNNDIYKNIEPKIVFVLKETNEHESSLTNLLDTPFSGKYHLDNESTKDGNNRIIKNLRKTWLNIARWTLGIDNFMNEAGFISWNKIYSEPAWYKREWLNELKKIGVVNIKKTSGKSNANNNELIQAVKDYGDLTFEQIKSYKPNIVIFCGVSSIFNTHYLMKYKIIEKIDWIQTNMGYWYFKLNNTFYIQFWHPNAHFPNNMMFYALIDIIKEIQKKT